MVRKISLFSLLVLGIALAVVSCNNSETIAPAEVESPNLRTAIHEFAEKYAPMATVINGSDWGSKMPRTGGCGPEVHGNCTVLEGVERIVSGDAPSYCNVRVTATVTICEDAEGNFLISFVPTNYDVLVPDPNSTVSTDIWCTEWQDQVQACIDAGDFACAVELIDALNADAADQFELDYMRGYVEFHEGAFLCDGPNANAALRTEYYSTSCAKVCEINEPPVWQIVNCGEGCCIKTREYCETLSGGVTSGPASYSFVEGSCSNTGERCKPVIECYSRDNCAR